jgi:DNA-binding transcriptional ArsR family regulator
VVDARVFRALADENRREMLAMLSRRPLTSSELGEPFAMSAPAISQHLGLLRDAGLVHVERVGKYRLYTLSTQPLADVATWLAALEETWRSRLSRLEKVVERLAQQEKRARHARS